MRTKSIRRIGAVLVTSLLVYASPVLPDSRWSDAELTLLQQQWIGNLPPLPNDPSNRFADNAAAAELGQRLFFDPRLSANGKVSCATCHVPQNHFTDGRPLARGIGETSRSTPTIPGIAYSPWFFWDGRSDSLWSQALGPMESAVEHGGNRAQYARTLFSDPQYRSAYEDLFGPLPNLTDTGRFPLNASPVGDEKALTLWQSMSARDRQAITRVYANMGKAIAAYERKLLPGPARFDRYVEALLKGQHESAEQQLSASELAGLKLFIGKARCVTCHQGPLFTNHGFHNVGTPDPATRKPDYLPAIIYLFLDKPETDQGRYQGVRLAQQSEFNCLGEYSDANETDCAELKYANTDYRATLGAFKVPTLRNVSRTAPYTHAGYYETLREVLNHYNNPPEAPVGHSELAPIGLTKRELKQLEDFLGSLDSPVNADERLLRPPALQ
jgi:cytochrome c peroxidase